MDFPNEEVESFSNEVRPQDTNTAIKQINEDDFTIDISKKNDDFVHRDEFYPSNAKVEVYTPKAGAIINRIRDDSRVIWESDEPIERAEVVHRAGVAFIVKVHFNEGIPRYFIDGGPKWVETTSVLFNGMSEALSAAVETRERITMDGDKFEENLWEIRELKYGDVKILVLFPKSRCLAKAVVAREKEIWKAKNEDERCVLAALFYYKGTAELAKLLIIDDGASTCVYFKYDEDQWIKTDEDEYIRTAKFYSMWFPRMLIAVDDYAKKNKEYVP